VGDSCIRDRQLLVRVNNVFMFPADAEDLAHDRATLQQTLIETLARSFTIRSNLSNGRYRAVARRGRNE
jgi:hypothetical protein